MHKMLENAGVCSQVKLQKIAFRAFDYQPGGLFEWAKFRADNGITTSERLKLHTNKCLEGDADFASEKAA